jgi:SAM-dependent methyltransferase
VSAAAKPEYPGRDLEAMSFAVRYHTWIRDEFAAAVHGDVAEVGAGDGEFSRMLLELGPRSLTLFEPSSAMYERQAAKLGGDARVQRENATFTERAAAYENKLDTIVYVNVLEHVEDDRNELALMHRALRPDGRVCIFVPALQWLMSDHDRAIGHFRRYGRRELQTKVREAGFDIEQLHFFDSLGVLSWWLCMRVLKLPLKAGSVDLYDRMFVPVLRTFESIVRPPLGKNLLLIARRR